MLEGNRFGKAGSRVVVEEFLSGEEASFIGGRNRNTRRKPSTCRKSLTNCIT
jgi:phosphoribosylamine-glycine ligase